MQNIDNFTIIQSVVLLLLALLTPFINPFFRNVRKKEYSKQEDAIETAAEKIKKELPSISILLTPTDNAEELSKNLSLYLNQSYPVDFQVVVVASENDKETEYILKQYLNERLYFTFVPDTSRYVSKKKLAVTLGVKAAKYNWVVMIDIFCKPISENWLRSLAEGIAKDTDMVVGNTVYDAETSDFLQFERFQMTQYLQREYAFATPYRCENNALLFKKDMFLQNEGFRGNLKYLRGEFDFIVNKLAKKGNLKFIDSEEGTLLESVPSKKMYQEKRLFYIENRKNLERSAKHRFLFNLDQWILHLNYIIIISAGIFGKIASNKILLLASAIALFLTVIIRCVIFSKRSKYARLTIPLWKVIPYETQMVWHNLKLMLIHHRANKNYFFSHKL